MGLKTRLEVISKEDYTRIHEASLKILEETGVVFQSTEALEIFKNHGVKVDGKTVYYSRKLVEDSLEKCPSTFKWKARNDDNSVTIGERLLFQPNSGPLFIQDLDNGRRLGKLEDYVNIIKICQTSDMVNLAGSFPVDPSDVNQDEKYLFMMYETLKHTDKPIVGFSAYGHQGRHMLDMVEIAMGRKGFMQENHCIGVGVNPTSPLKYSPEACGTIIEYAKRNQVIFLSSAVMAGLSGPIHLIGTSVLHNVEVLAGIILAQLINPENPVVYGAISTVAGMRKANFITGSPETMLINIANLQMGLNFYHLPTRALCGMTDAKTIDCQAGYETMQNMMMGMLGGAQIIGECLGVLDSIMTTSYEKIIIDLEILSRIVRIWKGIDTSDKALSVDIIQEVGHDGTYLTHPSTFEYCRDGWLPTVSDWELYEDWEKQGSKDVVTQANKKYKEILMNAPESLIDLDTDKDLKAYMSKVI